MSNEYKDWLFDCATDKILELGIEKIEECEKCKNGWIFRCSRLDKRGKKINVIIKYTNDQIDAYYME